MNFVKIGVTSFEVIKTSIAFTDKKRALDFEAYLKNPSGRAFVKKRL